MAEIVFDIHQDNFTTQSSHNLSALIGANRFFFYLSDNQKRIVFQRHYLFKSPYYLSELEGIFKNENLFKHQFHQVNVAIDTPHFAFIPNIIYEAELQKNYLQQTAPISSNDMIFTDEVDELELKNVHSVDNRLYDILDKHLAYFDLYHNATPFLRRTNRMIQGNDVIVNVLPAQLQIAVYKNNQFQIYNTFKYNSAEAFLYYVLLMYQQFELDNMNTPLTLMGGIMPNSVIYRLLSTYIRQIKFAKRTKYYQYSPKYSTVPQQFHFDLYTMSVCE